MFRAMKSYLVLLPLAFASSGAILSGLSSKRNVIYGSDPSVKAPDPLLHVGEPVGEPTVENGEVLELSVDETDEDKPYMVLGDMMYTKESWTEWTNLARGSIRPEVNPSVRWPKDDVGNVIVPYELDYRAFEEAGVAPQFVFDGFKQWEDGTCVKAMLKELVEDDPRWRNSSLWVTPSGSGCSSYVGMMKKPKQALRLGPGCRSVLTVAHEFGHALGLGHEHQRSDREKHLVLFPENQNPGSHLDMDLEPWLNFKVPFNYLSNLHYFWYAFSINPAKNMPTMLPIDPTLQYLISGSHAVSHFDRLVVNKGYGCLDTWKAKCRSKIVCNNWGYLGPDCSCICPEGTSGEMCENLEVESLPFYPPPECGGHITEDGEYKSSEKKKTNSVNCVWWVRPPRCYIAKIVMTKFALAEADSDSKLCSSEYFGVRSIGRYEPDETLKCGDTVKEGDVFIGKPDIVLDYQSYRVDGEDNGVGFKVSFEPDPICTIPPKPSARACLFHKHEDGAISVYSPQILTAHCNVTISFPGAKWIRIASKLFDVPSADADCNDGHVAFTSSGYTPRAVKCNRGYMSHSTSGSMVTVHYKPSASLQSEKGFWLLFYPTSDA